MQGMVQLGDQVLLPLGYFCERHYLFHQRQNRRALRSRDSGKIK